MPPTDEQLIRAALGGDPAAYDALMERYERLVFKVAYGFAGTREGALDIVQSAFLKALRSLPDFRGESAFKTWLLRIVLNEGQDARRRHGARDARHEPIEALAGHESKEPGPEELALRGERRLRLLRGLDGLNPRHRLAVTLRYFLQGLSVPEIAAALECTETTARNMLFRSLRRLRGALDGAQESQ